MQVASGSIWEQGARVPPWGGTFSHPALIKESIGYRHPQLDPTDRQ
ncbi:hypothetical protein ATKI12_2584 [Kitasatospora sp. Ki12]